MSAKFYSYILSCSFILLMFNDIHSHQHGRQRKPHNFSICFHVQVSTTFFYYLFLYNTLTFVCLFNTKFSSSPTSAAYNFISSFLQFFNWWHRTYNLLFTSWLGTFAASTYLNQSFYLVWPSSY